MSAVLTSTLGTVLACLLLYCTVPDRLMHRNPASGTAHISACHLRKYPAMCFLQGSRVRNVLSSRLIEVATKSSFASRDLFTYTLHLQYTAEGRDRWHPGVVVHICDFVPTCKVVYGRVHLTTHLVRDTFRGVRVGA